MVLVEDGGQVLDGAGAQGEEELLGQLELACFRAVPSAAAGGVAGEVLLAVPGGVEEGAGEVGGLRLGRFVGDAERLVELAVQALRQEGEADGVVQADLLAGDLLVHGHGFLQVVRQGRDDDAPRVEAGRQDLGGVGVGGHRDGQRVAVHLRGGRLRRLRQRPVGLAAPAGGHRPGERRRVVCHGHRCHAASDRGHRRVERLRLLHLFISLVLQLLELELVLQQLFLGHQAHRDGARGWWRGCAAARPV